MERWAVTAVNMDRCVLHRASEVLPRAPMDLAATKTTRRNEAGLDVLLRNLNPGVHLLAAKQPLGDAELEASVRQAASLRGVPQEAPAVPLAGGAAWYRFSPDLPLPIQLKAQLGRGRPGGAP